MEFLLLKNIPPEKHVLTSLKQRQKVQSRYNLKKQKLGSEALAWHRALAESWCGHLSVELLGICSSVISLISLTNVLHVILNSFGGSRCTC